MVASNSSSSASSSSSTRQIINDKRWARKHTEADIRHLIEGLQNGAIPDYQISAWLMAACINGLDIDETTWLTQALVDSGTVLDLESQSGAFVDKHSTGGVGDKATLILVPLLASCGVKIAKLSGRALGFTGGTIDKLEAIPGFNVALSQEAMFAQLKTIGCAISGQTRTLAPADGRLYALRDVTGTVESIPLIAASVMSKKIAAGAATIVLDIKVGRGAFMKTPDAARQLASTCRAIGERLGKTIATVISNMDSPLGLAIGNSVEVAEAIEVLQGEGPADVRALCIALGAIALVESGQYETLSLAETALMASLDSGKALKTFKALIDAQGGDSEVLQDASLLPQPDRIKMLPAPEAGYVNGIDPLKIAEAVNLLGAGRKTRESPIDLGVGVVLRYKIGEYIEAGDALLEVYATDDFEKNAQAMALLLEAYKIKPEKPEGHVPLIHELCMNRPGHLADLISLKAIEATDTISSVL
ncbi:MAG: thymidine phosphorylase [Vampirovibrionales bacterium]|nr:thymidine phosphorylase [Vampirovibrionales bacterium]